MRNFFIIFCVFFLSCVGPGGPLPDAVDRPQEIAGPVEHADHLAQPQFRPFLKTTTTLHCLLVGGPVDRDAPAGPVVHLHYQNPAASQPNLRLVGTDLGFAFMHQSTNIMLFGDTWPLPTVPQDDSLATFPPQERDSCPILTFPAEAEPPENLPVKPIRVFHPDPMREWIAYPMGAFKTPLAGFSSGDKAYGIFGIGMQHCSARFPCDPGDICALEICFAPAGTFRLPDYPRARPRSIAAASTLPDFYEEGLLSLRNFVNIAVRVVPHFDPENPVANVYYLDPAVSFEEQATRPALLVWGKPSFGSFVVPPATYLMYYDLTATGADRWIPHYYTGIVAGVPQWSTVSSSEKIAPRLAPVITSEAETISGTPIRNPAQISVSFVPSLGKWIMFYGGRPAGNPAARHSSADDPNLGIYMREADDPWGPWSLPRRIWSAVADGGHTSFMYHPLSNPNAYDYNLGNVTDIPDFVAARNGPYDYGAEYGASIIDSLTWHDTAANRIHIYWAMSTWNPYRVVLMHTILEYSFGAVR